MSTVNGNRRIFGEGSALTPSVERALAKLHAAAVANHAALTQDGKSYVREVYRALERARREVRGKLAAVLADVGPDDWTYAKVGQPARLEALLRELNAAMDSLVAEHKVLAGDAVRAGYARGWEASQDYLGRAGVAVDFVSVDPRRAAAVAELPIGGLPMSDRFRMAGEYVHQKIREEMTHSLLLGEGYKKCEARVVKATGIPAVTAARVVRTGMAMANGVASVDNYRRLGVGEYERVAGPNACELCSGLSGERFSVEEPFEVLHLC